MWLVDTGCGYDLASKREVALMKTFVEKAKHTITFHTANGPTVTEDVADVYVKELDENITLYIYNNIPPVLTVGYRCMEMGYTFIWPTGQKPFSIRLDGMIAHLAVGNYFPYLIPGSSHCKPKKSTGSLTFCSASPVISREKQKSGDPGAVAGAVRPKSTTKVKQCRDKHCVVPSDSDAETEMHSEPELVEEEEQPSSGDESFDRMSRAARESLRDEANSLYHLLTHKPKNPYCEACRRAKMKEKRKHVGPHQNNTTHWGQFVTGDHITSTKDNMLGIGGSKDMLVLKMLSLGSRQRTPWRTRVLNRPWRQSDISRLIVLSQNSTPIDPVK